jgi:hypothetical protein
MTLPVRCNGDDIGTGCVGSVVDALPSASLSEAGQIQSPAQRNQTVQTVTDTVSQSCCAQVAP